MSKNKKDEYLENEEAETEIEESETELEEIEESETELEEVETEIEDFETELKEAIVELEEGKTILYEVRKGDNLYKIAKDYNVDVKKLYQDNKEIIGNNPNIIRVGMILTINVK